MKNKRIHNFLANQRMVVSNFLEGFDSLIIGDTEKVLDIKNQYIFQTYMFSIALKLDKNKDFGYAYISADTMDKFTDFHFYPLIEIKKKGSGINDILKKNNHLPSAFVCVHDFTPINRRDFDLIENYKIFTKKENFIDTIKITNKSICFYPVSNNIKNNPFETIFDDKKSPKPFEKYDENKIRIFQKELDIIKKQKNKKKGMGDIIKCNVENGTYSIYNPSIRVEDEEFEGKLYPKYNSFIFVVKK